MNVFNVFTRLETIALAEKNKVLLEAEAKAESIRLKGEAQAFAIEAKAVAESTQMVKKADAFKEYQSAAMVDMILEMLPRVVAEVAAPLTKTKKIVSISSGEGDLGAAKLTSEVLEVVRLIPSVVENLTGFDISKTMGSGR